MDFWTLAGVTMLVVWGWITYTTTAPGWLHLLLTAGVFLIIWRIVVRATPEPAASPPSVRSERKR